MNQLSSIDILLLVAYAAYLIFVAIKYYSRRQLDSAEDFLLAGRTLTLPAFIATMVTTWYGGILGVGEFSYLYGISNWLVFGVPYYLFALIFAIFIAKKARQVQLYTIPDKLTAEYGKPTGTLGALFVFIMTVPAGYVLMLGILLQILFGWSLNACVILGAFFSLFYVLAGGFRTVIKTDMVQFGLMFGGFFLILSIVFFEYGGLSFLRANIPADHFVWHGGNPTQYILVWYFLAMATLVEPAFYQRCYAAKTEDVARKGIFGAVAFWIFFDFLTTFTGLYARALLPDLENAVQAYPMLALEVLPPFLKGLFFLAMFATIMSTIDSYSFLAAMTIGRDFIWQLRGESTEENLSIYTRWGLLVTAILTIAMALWFESIIDVWHDVGSVGTPALLIPLASSFSVRWRMRPKFAFGSMSIAGLLSFLWVLNSYFPLQGQETTHFMNIEPIFPGLVASVAIFVLDHLTRSE